MGTSFWPDVGSMYRTLAGYGLRLYGSASGYVGLKPSANAGNTDYTLPVNAPTVDGQLIAVTQAGLMSFVNPPNGYVWSEITGGTVNLAAWNAYLLNNASRVIGTLPASGAVGDQIRIAGKGAGGWRVAQNAGQTVHFGTQSSTTGTGGSISSVNSFDVIELVCITQNTDWLVLNSLGNLAVV